MTSVKGCPHSRTCKAETDYGTGVTECFHKDSKGNYNCNAIGYLGKSGNLYNHPKYVK